MVWVELRFIWCPVHPTNLTVTICTTTFDIQISYVQPTQYIHVFRVDLRTKSFYFSIQHYWLPFITETVCLLRGTDWIFTANLFYIQSSWMSTLVLQIVLEQQTDENSSFLVVLMCIEFIFSSPGDISCNHNKWSPSVRFITNELHNKFYLSTRFGYFL
jgi:hypothetical protein